MVSDVAAGFSDDGPAGVAVASGSMGWVEESGRMGADVDSAVGVCARARGSAEDSGSGFGETEIDGIVAGMSVTKDVSSSRVKLPLVEIPASKGVPWNSVGIEDMEEVPACRDVPDGVG